MPDLEILIEELLATELQSLTDEIQRNLEKYRSLREETRALKERVANFVARFIAFRESQE